MSIIREVIANAGLNLNTSALALEAGGNLAAIKTDADNLPLIKAKTDNLDVLLSTRLKPADTLAAVTTVGTITNPVLAAQSGVWNVGLNNDVLSPFGDLSVAPITPILQLDFVYGVNSQTGISTVLNSATVDTNASRLRLQTGTNTAGSAIFNSRRSAKYRPGQGVIARFTAAFTTGVANSTQIIGAGNSVDGYFFGFNGATFGVLHRNASSDSWVAQTSWNGDKCDGSGISSFNWNKTFGCVCQIKYPYLGYGDITFWVQDPLTTRWILCHTIRYNNSTASVQLSNPNLFFYSQVVNSGNNTNLIMYCGSVGFFLSGERNFIGNPKWAADSNKSGITTETVLLNLKNCTTFNGITNRSLIRLNSISGSNNAAAGIAVIRLKIGATIGGSPSYATINGTTADGGVTITNGNSVASVDVAGTTVANGTYIFNITLSSPGNLIIDLIPYNIIIAPSEILTISGFSTNSTLIGISLNWTEDI